MSFDQPPVRRDDDRFVISIGVTEREIVTQLLKELADMLAEPESGPSNEVLQRLFPVVYDNDPEREAEYQRLMREELVASKLAAIETVTAALEAAQPSRSTLDEAQMTVDEAGLVALMQSINSVRLVLGTIVDVEELEDEEAQDDRDGRGGGADDEFIEERLNSAEYQLYIYLSWLLDWCVTAISGNTNRFGAR